VVDDADTEPPADVAALVRHTRGSPRVRVLLVVRDPTAFAALLDEQLTPGPGAGGEALTLAVVGGAGDRRRFFANAVRGFRPQRAGRARPAIAPGGGGRRPRPDPGRRRPAARAGARAAVAVAVRRAARRRDPTPIPVRFLGRRRTPGHPGPGADGPCGRARPGRRRPCGDRLDPGGR
jgi:hypothetical protein